jgi:iron only hydrogenase large subunit-like protein
MLTPVKKIGFDGIFEASAGTEIITNVIKNHILKNPEKKRPIINSTCPATLRLIQIRFPELLPNVADIETPIEIRHAFAKAEAVRKTGFFYEEIGVNYIFSLHSQNDKCKTPDSIKKSYIDGVLSMKDVIWHDAENFRR